MTMMGNSNAQLSLSSSFVLFLMHDVNTNVTSLPDRISKHPSMNSDYRYQNVMKILNNSREALSKCN